MAINSILFSSPADNRQAVRSFTGSISSRQGNEAGRKAIWPFHVHASLSRNATVSKGNKITNVNDGRNEDQTCPYCQIALGRNTVEEIDQAGAGEVVAIFGDNCRLIDTFLDGSTTLATNTMFVPEPVISLAVKPTKFTMQNQFGKAIAKFTKEDPTLWVKVDSETKETILSGMGELHLEVHIERMNREYGVECVSGQPNINKEQTFDWLHKKQTGGSGQYAWVIGYIEQMTEEKKTIKRAN